MNYQEKGEGELSLLKVKNIEYRGGTSRKLISHDVSEFHPIILYKIKSRFRARER